MSKKTHSISVLYELSSLFVKISICGALSRNFMTMHRVSVSHLKGCVRYIFACLFLSLNESPCQTRKNVFYFTSKALFVLEKIRF